jgi:hypothetical protein
MSAKLKEYLWKCFLLIAFDECTIKNSKGVILACCSIDAGQNVPLAFALASMEDTK